MKNRKWIEEVGNHDLKIELMKALGEEKKVKDLLMEKASAKIVIAKAISVPAHDEKM